MVELIDSHCHLDEERFDGDRDDVIGRAKAAGVTRMITVGASGPMQANYDALRISADNDGVYATIGIHPHNASMVTAEIVDEMERLARQPKVVAIGETGLDYYYDNSPREQQRQALRLHIQLARRVNLPIVLHLRDAYDDAARILAAEGGREIGGVVHCFSGDRDDARTFLDLGFDISFSGIVTFKNADELRAAAAMVPAERFMVETDAPFLAPVPHRGKRNEPAFVVHTAAAIAQVRKQPVDTIAAAATANATRRFRLDR
jgi:TatD DNase family protein